MLVSTRVRRPLFAGLFAVVLTTALMAGPALAITDGELDGSGHPYVGLMVAQDVNGAPMWRCSGTLMSARVFLTAGHCTESPAAHIEIWFAAGPIPLAAGYPTTSDPLNPCDGITIGYPCVGDVGGNPLVHPDYDPNAFFLRDLGAVYLDASMAGPYGALPGLNSLDSLTVGRQTTFTAVGYGLQKSFPAAAGWKNSALRVRMVAHPWLLQINKGLVGDFSMLLSNNTKSGGTCFGDSGGPNFLGSGTSNVVAGVTSFGLNGTCGGTGGVFRMDRSWSLDFVADAADGILGN